MAGEPDLDRSPNRLRIKEISVMKTTKRSIIYLPMVAMINWRRSLATPGRRRRLLSTHSRVRSTGMTPSPLPRSLKASQELAPMSVDSQLPRCLHSVRLVAQGRLIGSRPMGTASIRPLSDRPHRWIWPLARLWVRSLKTVTLRSRKFTPLPVARVDSPASRGALP